MENNLDILGAIKSTGIEVLKDYGDKGLEEFAKIFDKSILQDVPYVSTIVNLATFGTNIKQYFLAKKLIKFLTQLDSIPLNDRQNFVSKFEDPKKSKKIGEKLIVLIDSLDEDEKAEILGKLFKKTIEKKIDIETFNRLAIGIKNIYLTDLNLFIEWNSQSTYDLHEDTNSSLYQNGFLSINLKEVKIDKRETLTMMGHQNLPEQTLSFKVSELGKKFLNNID